MAEAKACQRISILSKPWSSSAGVVALGGTGTARKVEAARLSRKAIRRFSSNAVTSGLSPQLTSQPPPSRSLAEPQQWLVLTAGSKSGKTPSIVTVEFPVRRCLPGDPETGNGDDEKTQQRQAQEAKRKRFAPMPDGYPLDYEREPGQAGDFRRRGQ